MKINKDILPDGIFGGETQTLHSLDMREARTEHGINWRVLGANYEGARVPIWGYKYEATVGSRPYVPGENRDCDKMLSEAIALEAKITAGDVYRDFPEITVERLMIIKDIEQAGAYAEEPEFPTHLVATHERFILRRKLQGDLTIQTVEIK